TIEIRQIIPRLPPCLSSVRHRRGSVFRSAIRRPLGLKEALVRFETLLVDTSDDGVATVTFNRPKKKNAMSPSLHRDMTAALDALRYDAAVKVVVITGAGDAFCAGMDLKEFFTDLKSDPAEYDRVFRMATEWRGR